MISISPEISYHDFSCQKIPIRVMVSTTGENLEQISLNTHFSDVGLSQPHPSRSSFPQIHEKLVHILDSYFQTGKIDNLSLWSEFHLTRKFSTPFSQQVYHEMCKIPPGNVKTYGQIATAVQSRAYQAIGSLLRNNPFPLLIPCHRVVSKTGLGGFMGETDPTSDALRLKKALLHHEEGASPQSTLMEWLQKK